MEYDQIVDALPKALDTFWVPTLDNSGVAFTAAHLRRLTRTTDRSRPATGRRDEDSQNNAVYCSDEQHDRVRRRVRAGLYGLDWRHGVRVPDHRRRLQRRGADGTQSGSPARSARAAERLPRRRLDLDIVPSGIDAERLPGRDNPAQEILLSAGDLDEVVITAVLEGDEAARPTPTVGTAFEKIDAFRDGVLGGLQACQARLGTDDLT
jgi:hypothetical protein